MSEQQPIKFDKSFTGQIDEYITKKESRQEKPTINGFAARLNVSVETLWQWANKKKKDDNGNILDELARPNFHAGLTKLKAIEENEIVSVVVEEPKKTETPPVVEEKQKVEKLKPQQELFCQMYARSKEHFGNATQSYAVAYGIDLENKEVNNSVRAMASNLLTKINILRRIDELLQDITDQEVDQELSWLIRQRYELPTKVAAIREYNKVKGRIIDKIDHTTKGKELPTPIYGGKSTGE